ncbi:MerC domain-containing protein [Sediminibacterium sp.]|uniref:MerC domain-containing protein n=1 Tax=Sediminibacterium sp. TaxID=1917865 RepID=UPI0027358FF9|nr:MerC domain-containing protein [Sediminibacterium sp.]MDP3394687.1 MerC domain-containing protein [Sediminibacterium sp.]MDP3568522.1 MerC domain-containing protein [Sediminibacterium sp.]
MKFKMNWDALGIATSVACAIHCALLPLFLSSLPLFGVNIIENIRFEYFMIVLAFVLGIYALYHGFKKHHHSWWPISLFSLGILFLIVKVNFHQLELILLIPSVGLIVVAHYLNFKLCRVHDHAHKDDCAH